jgi:hypothetical protein
MLMRGSQKHTRAELRDAFDRLKAGVSAGVEGVSIDVRRAQLDDTLRLVAEVLRVPAFPPAEFEELKRASLTGAEAQRGDPAAIASERLARHLNPYPRGHWLYTESVDERLDELKAAKLEDAKRCYTDLVGASGAQWQARGDISRPHMPARRAGCGDRPCARAIFSDTPHGLRNQLEQHRSRPQGPTAPTSCASSRAPICFISTRVCSRCASSRTRSRKSTRPSAAK